MANTTTPKRVAELLARLRELLGMVPPLREEARDGRRFICDDGRDRAELLYDGAIVGALLCEAREALPLLLELAAEGLVFRDALAEGDPRAALAQARLDLGQALRDADEAAASEPGEAGGFARGIVRGMARSLGDAVTSETGAALAEQARAMVREREQT